LLGHGNADAAKAIILRSGVVDITETRQRNDLESAVAVMTYPLAALSVGLVSIPLLFVVWRMVKAPIRTRDLVFLGLLGSIFLIQGASELIGPWVTNLIYILAGVGR
jgi:hypothetical protein